MKSSFKTSLSTAIMIALAAMGANAQQNPSAQTPNLYTTVSQGEIYIIQGDKQIELKVGEAAVARENSLQQIKSVPGFLNWPCGNYVGADSGLMPTYSLADLPPANQVEEIVRRFFEGLEIPAPSPAWLVGESHGSFPADEINKFLTSAYWYESGPTTPKMEALRPRVLLISLYPATQQVIVDQNHFQELLDEYGSKDIPVTFVFNEENVVPVSYFGKNVTLQQVADAYFEKGMSIADVPMWYAGDRQFTVSPQQLEKAFDIPAIEDIDPDRLAALVAELQANGFSNKPIKIALIAQNNSMVVDEGEKVRAAQSLGMDSIPIVFFNYDENSHKKRCGLVMPRIGAGGEAASSEPGVDPPQPLPPEKPISGN